MPRTNPDDHDLPRPGRPSTTTEVSLNVKQRFTARVERSRSWVEERRSETLPLDLAISFYERDREQFASVLGAAIALRLFLFMVPAVVVGVGVVTAVIGPQRFQAILEQASVTGRLAGEINTATAAARSTWLVVLFTGLWLTIWAGRNLAIVLATCSGAAWQLDARARRVTIRSAATITSLALAIVLIAAVVNRIRNEFGFAGATTSWVLATVVFSAAWFAVCWALPKGTPDPGAILPGAALVGVSLTLLQWFMQIYLPSRLTRASALVGGAGSSVAVLGAMFLIGRVMASSFILNAVIFERLGSISALVFALPVLRALPKRFPRLGAWFDLPASADR